MKSLKKGEFKSSFGHLQNMKLNNEQLSSVKGGDPVTLGAQAIAAAYQLGSAVGSAIADWWNSEDEC